MKKKEELHECSSQVFFKCTSSIDWMNHSTPCDISLLTLTDTYCRNSFPMLLFFIVTLIMILRFYGKVSKFDLIHEDCPFIRFLITKKQCMSFDKCEYKGSGHLMLYLSHVDRMLYFLLWYFSKPSYNYFE